MRKALLFTLACLLGIWSVKAEDVPANIKDGLQVGVTEYVIDSPAGLVRLADLVNNEGETMEFYTFEMTGNIDLNKLEENDWDPIGTGTPFKGTFDGKDKTIKNLTITENNVSYNRGLFGHIDGATIKNLILEDVSIESYKTPGSVTYTTGAVAGLITGSASAVKNCHVSGVVIGTGISYTGGLIGNLIAGGISLCSNSATVSVGTDSEIPIHFIGGLVGASSGTISSRIIDQCFNQGVVTGKNIGTLNIGGLVGYVVSTNSEISNSYNVGNIVVDGEATGDAFTGGIAGNSKAKIENCYSCANITGGTLDNSATGGLIGMYKGGSVATNLALSQSLTGNNDNTYSLIGKIENEGDLSGIQQNYAWLKGEEDSYYGVDGPEGAKTGSLWTGSMSDQPFAGNWNFEDDDSWDFSGADALMPKLKGEMLVKQPDIKNPLKASSETPPSPTYHTITLEVAPGIDLYGMTAGNHQVAENGHLFLQFLPEATTATAADIFFVIDGIETAFNDLGAGKYFSYILNSIKQNHSILIAMKEYAVTLPEVEGVAINVGAGVHQVAYGEKFSFTLTLDDSIDPAKVQVFANGTEIQPDALRATVLSYTIDKVITSIVVVIEGTNTTSNAELTHGMRVVVESGKLKVENGTANAVDVAVYSITGQHMVQLRGLRGSKTITLQPGVYIVRAGTQTWKVMVND